MSDNAVVDGGYYVETIRGTVGTGDTTRDSQMENYYRAQVLGDDSIRMELLDNNDMPTGYSEVVKAGEIGARFKYVPDFTPKEIDPKKERVDKMCARADRHLEKDELLSAEFEYGKALKLDEESVRANFGLGKTYLAQGEGEKAKDAFKKLADIEAITEPRHKHIFNEFGMQLRKLRLYGEAAQHYRKALAISGQDENLWFNLGRTFLEGGDRAKAAIALSNALKLNPDMKEAKKLLDQVQHGQ
jgi:tetratricopeptide (TPR) repeat protein